MALPRRRLLATVGALLLGGVATPLRAAIGDRVVSDRYTGIAIFGYDPVSYFTDASPVSGRPEFELKVDDVIWRFRNAGNRAAFIAHPEIYQPRYGGYDPVAVARGVAVAGNPLLFVISRERLYLFYSKQAREAFAADPDTAVALADEHWPEILQGLAR